MIKHNLYLIQSAKNLSLKRLCIEYYFCKPQKVPKRKVISLRIKKSLELVQQCQILLVYVLFTVYHHIILCPSLLYCLFYLHVRRYIVIPKSILTLLLVSFVRESSQFLEKEPLQKTKSPNFFFYIGNGKIKWITKFKDKM